MAVTNNRGGRLKTMKDAERRMFQVKGPAGGMPGDMGLADSGPAGADYPATLNAYRTGGADEYAADAESVNPPGGQDAG